MKVNFTSHVTIESLCSFQVSSPLDVRAAEGLNILSFSSAPSTEGEHWGPRRSGDMPGAAVDVGLSPGTESSPPHGSPSPCLGIFPFLRPAPLFLSCHILLPFPWNAFAFQFFLFLPVSSSPSAPCSGKGECFVFGPPFYKIEFSLNTTVSLPLLCCESAKSFLLPVAANVISFTPAPDFTVYAQLDSSLPMNPKDPLGLLWVCPMHQPCSSWF